MRSTFSQVLWGASILSLFATAPLLATDRRPCKECLKFERAMPVVVMPPTVAVFAPDDVILFDEPDLLILAPSANHSQLVVNCPPETRVTIDGRVTHSSGSMRQFDLSYARSSHKCRVELRLRDNEKNVTYQFEQSLELRPHRQVVLSVTRAQMEPVADSDREKEIAKMFKPGSKFTVNEDGKLEHLDDDSKTKESAIHKGDVATREVATAPHDSKTVTLDQRSREHLKKLLAEESDTEKRLAKQEQEKSAHWQAAARNRTRISDAYQLKVVEVNNAANDSAAVLATRRLEAKRLELELANAVETERLAKIQLEAAQHDLKIAKQRLSGTQRAIELVEQRIVIKQLDKEIAEAQENFKTLQTAINHLQRDKNKATESFKESVKARIERRDENLETQIRSAVFQERELLQRISDTQRKLEEAQRRIQQKSDERTGILNNTIPVELP